jgi:hypothetical protein
MTWELPGRLTSRTGDHPTFEGFRIEAFVGGRPLAVPTSVPCDEAGNFTLLLPDVPEIGDKPVKLVVTSLAGDVIREMEVMVTDLERPITMELDELDPTSPMPGERPTPAPDGVVSGRFRNSAALRSTLTENLRPLRVESQAIAARVDKAFEGFDPSPFSADERSRRHHVRYGADPIRTLENVMTTGVDTIRSSDVERTIALRATPELKGLIQELPEGTDPGHGVVELGHLIDYVSRKAAGSALVTEPAYAACNAELEADRIIDAVESPAGAANADGGAAPAASNVEELDADQLVEGSVRVQMDSATSPEARLAFGSMPKIPNDADSDAAQKGILQTFEVRPGASDVTSYHDFHTLQIAFAHVWSQVFDGQLTRLGRELYQEYVKLKAFVGSDEEDIRISTVDDLTRLMEAITKLSQTVQTEIPSDLYDHEGPSEETNRPTSVTKVMSDVAKGGVAVLTGGVSLAIEWAINEISRIGQKTVIRWQDFPGPFPPRTDTIEVSFDYNVAPADTVELRLKTDPNSSWRGIELQWWDEDAGKFQHGPGLSNGGHVYDVTLAAATSLLPIGVLVFSSEQTTGNNRERYLLRDLTQKLVEGTRVTFYWKG